MTSPNLQNGHPSYTWIVEPLPFDEGLSTLLAAFVLHGKVAGHSERTIEARVATVERLAREVGDVHDLDGEALIDWLAGLGLSRASMSTYRSHLRAFFSWLHKTGRRVDNPATDIPATRTGRGLPHPVSPVDLQLILAACMDPRARQTRAYVLLGAYEGLRVHEIAKVRGEDVTPTELMVSGKGGVVSTVPLHPVVAVLAESMPRTGYWFPSSSSTGHVSRVTVSQAISRAMRRAGVAGTPHGLRHHFGTQVLRGSGGDLRTTQRVMRHASPATTAIYTQVLDETAFRAVSLIPA